MGATPTEVVTSSLQLAAAGDFDAYVDLCTEDVVFEFPFAPPGRPRRVEGRENLAAYLGAFPGRIEFVALTEFTVHETTDPEVIVVEMRAEGRIRATGEPYEMGYISVVTVRAGRIVRYRDYWNPLMAMATA